MTAHEPVEPIGPPGAEWSSVLSFADRLLDHVQAAIIATDLSGVILYANRYAVDLYGRPRTELLGADSSAFTVDPVDPRVTSQIGAALAAGRAWSGEFRVRRGDGTVITVGASDSGIYDERGLLVGVASVAIDVTEPRAMEASLRASEARFARLAQTLQQSLLPPELPEVPGLEVASRFRPAGDGTEVGGDFFDLFETAKDDWAVMIGDVQGKGAQAATITALVRYTTRAAAMKNRKPSAILTVVNQALLGQHPERFCTMTYARIRRTGGRLRLAVAGGGHPLPVLVRAGKVSDVGRPGLLVGAFDEATFANHQVELCRDDVIVFFTDGVTEARAGSELWGETRLKELLLAHSREGAAQIAGRISDAVVSFQNGTPADDLAVLVIKVAG